MVCRINAQQLVIMGGINLRNAQSLADLWLFDVTTDQLHKSEHSMSKESRLPQCYSFGN